MRICSSVGSVTVAVPLLVTAISFLLLEILQHDIQPAEPLRPRALIRFHPVMDRLERVPVQPVQPLTSFVPHGNRSHLTEHSQVLRHLWLSQPERPHELVYGKLPAREGVQDLSPPGLGHCVERICCCRCSSHSRIVYTHMGIRQGRSSAGSTLELGEPPLKEAPLCVRVNQLQRTVVGSAGIVDPIEPA